MRIGTLCYATDSGLGILAKSFYDHGVVTDALVVQHGKHETHADWYPSSLRAFRPGDITELGRDLIRSVDAMLFFETPFDWTLISYCKDQGKKAVLMVMHECMLERPPVLPDLFLCPSQLEHDVCMSHWPSVKSVYLPVPVETPWRLRERAMVFVHNAGHGGLKGRNGTRELLEALKYVESPIKFLLRFQSHEAEYAPLWEKIPAHITVGAIKKTVPYDQLWSEGDVFAFPERFNGLSLPLQEARAAGMLVMGADRFPVNKWLPREPLIPVAFYQKQRIGPPYLEYDRAMIDPRDVAARMDEWYGKDISEYSLSGKRWAEANSWEVLNPRYMEILCA